MPTKAKKLMNYFQSHGGTARFSAVLKAGFHPDFLNALEKAGEVKKIARGLYQIAHQEIDSHPDLVRSALQAPRGVICLISALAFHEATNEIPHWVDMAIPQGTHANRVKYPPVKFYRFAPETWEAGIEAHIINGHKVRVYNLAKTVADCFKFRNKIGMDVAREALKIAVIDKKIKPMEIMRYAKICRVAKIMKPYLEALV